MYDASFKIIIFGDESTGKTTLIQNFCTNLFIRGYKMTVGVDFHKKILSVDGNKVQLMIWDLSGKEFFRKCLTCYIKNTLGGLFVFDIASSSSFACIDYWLSVIREAVGTELLFPILVVGLLPDDRNMRQVSTEEGVKIANSKNLYGYIECNPHAGENVEKVFENLTRLMLVELIYD